MSDANIPSGFDMPDELWMIVAPPPGRPVSPIGWGASYLIAFSRESAEADVDSFGDLDAVVVQVYPRPPAAPTVTIQSKDRPFIPLSDYNKMNLTDYKKLNCVGEDS